MILLDTSVLILRLCGATPLQPQLRALVQNREMLANSALVLCEVLRGARRGAELAGFWDLIPYEAALLFVAPEVVVAAGHYLQLPRARSRATDIAIAACALRHEARLWALNAGSLSDIPELQLLHR